MADLDFLQDQLYQFYNDANRQVAILCVLVTGFTGGLLALVALVPHKSLSEQLPSLDDHYEMHCEQGFYHYLLYLHSLPSLPIL